LRRLFWLVVVFFYVGCKGGAKQKLARTIRKSEIKKRENVKRRIARRVGRERSRTSFVYMTMAGTDSIR